MLTPQQIQEARQRLGSFSSNNSAPSVNKSSWSDIGFPSQSEQPSFIQSTKKIINKRANNLTDVVDSNQGFGSKVLQTAGQAAGAFGDIAFEGLKRITPEPIKNVAKAGIQKIAETKSAQDVMSSYGEWSKRHPEASKDFEAAFNLLSVLPSTKAAGTVTKSLEKGTAKLGEKIVVSGEKGIVNRTKNFALKLVKPLETKETKIADVARTTEKGVGPFKSSVIAPSPQEMSMAKVVEKVPKLDPNKTFQQNYNTIASFNKQKAIDLKSEIAKYKVAIPKKEIISKLDSVSDVLANSPVIVGDAEKTAAKLLEGAKKFVNKNPGSAEGLFQARKDYDIWVKSQKPAAFDAKAENAFTIANREIRNTLNDLLDAKIPDAKVKAKLMEQHNLINALDVVEEKAALEANSALGRFFQKAKSIIGTRNEAFNTTAAALGLGGIAAGSAAFAGPAAAIGIPALLMYKGTKFVLKPEFRVAAGKMLLQSSKVLKTLNNPVEIQALKEFNDTLKSYMK